MRILFSLTILPFLIFNSTVNAKEPEKQEQKQFTFSWQFIDSDTMKPRGGTTKGKKIDLSPRSYKDWRNDRDSKESKYEKDLVAIMSLTGMYRVSFDFLEIISILSNEISFIPENGIDSFFFKRSLEICP